MVQLKILRAIVLPLALLILATAGCSNFNHDWEVATQQPVQPNQLEGPWQGSWRSDVNGHNGALRCVITKKEDDSYRARFHAKYGKMLSFGYTVPLKAQPQDSSWKFQGQANLGFLAGGVYYYDGHADGTNFFSKYDSKYDHGTFQMKRP
jgi:hypothetical protein